MMRNLTVPASHNATLEITGDETGSFIIHERPDAIYHRMEECSIWRVTHIASGTRIPFDFTTPEAAHAFATEIEPIVDWSAIKVDVRHSTGIKAAWIEGKPTSEQLADIKRIARARGGLRP